MTVICAIPDCLRPSETHMCAGCWSLLRSQLTESGWLAAELELTRTRGDKPGSASIGFVSRSPESALSFREHASRASDRLRDILASWIRDLWETHAVRWQECGDCGGQWFADDQRHATRDCAGVWEEVMDTLIVAFSIPSLALWVLRHQTWVQTHPAAEELYAELMEAYRGAWRAIDRGAGRMYVGICSADITGEDGEAGTCERDLFTTDLGRTVTCPECGAQHSPGDRREVLTAALQHQYVQSGVLVGIVDRLGRELTGSMIRGYRHRGQLGAFVYDEEATPDDRGFRVRPVAETDDGATLLYRVGDVLDAMDRRYQRQAKEAS